MIDSDYDLLEMKVQLEPTKLRVKWDEAFEAYKNGNKDKAIYLLG